ncbi:hypothetical protein HK098_000612 [Nowakowskiella sp. JEL0407]|nr:hypothetical protein HK098_000612 [Nowakowskiella sp. JEL0407]
MEIWSPYGFDEPIDGVTVSIAQAAREFVFNNRNYTVIVRLVDWASIVVEPLAPCPPNRTPKDRCPDIIVLGTTQIASRMNANKPLDDYMGKWFQDTGISLRDDMSKGCFYDYMVKSKFQAIPLVSDIRVLFLNKTTFNRLNVPLPPPGSDTYKTGVNGSWNWDALTTLALRIKQITNATTFRFASGYHEEFKLLASMMRSWGLRMFKTQESTPYCGLKNKDFLQHFNNTILKLYRENAIFYCSSNPNPYPLRACNETTVMDRINAVEFSTIIDYEDIKRGATLGRSEVIEGFVPGSTTFLGGGGMLMTNITSNSDKTWELMSFIFDSRKIYLTQIGLFARSPPPYESIATISPWNSTEWTFAINALKTAVPLQWPDETFPELSILDSPKYQPGRSFMIDTLIRNVSLEDAAERACKSFDTVFAKACKASDQKYVVGSCQSNNTRKITFEWKSNLTCSTNSEIYRADPFPDPIEIDCQYIVVNSDTGIGMLIFSCVGIFMSILYSFGLYYYRNNSNIKASSPWFNQITLFGSILIYSSVILKIGDPKYATCTLSVWLFLYGFAFAFGSIFVKLYRIYKVFKRSSSAKSSVLKDAYLYILLGIIICIETILLLAYQFVNTPVVKSMPLSVTTVGDIMVESCSEPNPVTVALLIVFNGLLVGYTCFIAIQSRKAPPQYRENKFLFFIAYASAFVLVVIVPVYYGTASRLKAKFLLYGLAANFMTLSCTSIFCVSKIYSAYLHQSTQGGSTTKHITSKSPLSFPNPESLNYQPKKYASTIAYSFNGTRLDRYYDKDGDTRHGITFEQSSTNPGGRTSETATGFQDDLTPESETELRQFGVSTNDNETGMAAVFFPGQFAGKGSSSKTWAKEKTVQRFEEKKEPIKQKIAFASIMSKKFNLQKAQQTASQGTIESLEEVSSSSQKLPMMVRRVQESRKLYPTDDSPSSRTVNNTNSFSNSASTSSFSSPNNIPELHLSTTRSTAAGFSLKSPNTVTSTGTTVHSPSPTTSQIESIPPSRSNSITRNLSVKAAASSSSDTLLMPVIGYSTSIRRPNILPPMDEQQSTVAEIENFAERDKLARPSLSSIVPSPIMPTVPNPLVINQMSSNLSRSERSVTPPSEGSPDSEEPDLDIYLSDVMGKDDDPKSVVDFESKSQKSLYMDIYDPLDDFGN